MQDGNAATSLIFADTVVASFADRVQRFPDRPFVSTIHGGVISTRTYREAGAKVVAIADWMASQGLRKGDRVVTYIEDAEPLVWFCLASAALGVVPVPISRSYSVEAVAQLVAQCRAERLFTAAEDYGLVANIGVAVFVWPRGDVPPGAIALGERTHEDAPTRLVALAREIGRDDIYMFQPTSGSTGVPKLVMRRNVTFPRAGAAMSPGLGPEQGGEAGLLVQALTHGGGQYCLMVLIHLGGRICIPSTLDTGVKLDEVELLAPTYAFVVPRVLRSLHHQHAAKYGSAATSTPFLGARMRWLGVGGAPPDESILVDLERRGIEVIEGYGATEISLVAMTERGQRRAGSTGRLLPDVEVRIADDGELLVRSAFGMAGYFENDELTRAAYDADGNYCTGDLASVDADGYLRILGRKRDVFNSSEGSNIYPARIEEMVETLPEVAQVVLVGDARPFIVALVVPKTIPAGAPLELSPVDAATIYDAVRRGVAGVNQRLEQFERVRRIVLLGRPFDAALYAPVGHGKIRRDRNAVAKHFAPVIERLYAPASSELDVG